MTRLFIPKRPNKSTAVDEDDEDGWRKTLWYMYCRK